MKVFIIGNGRVGSLLCSLLVREKAISSIVCCDVRLNKRVSGKKIVYKKLNVNNRQQLLQLLIKERPFIVVNTSLPFFNKRILGCCVEKKVHYMDLASYWELPEKKKTVQHSNSPYLVEQLEFNPLFKKHTITGLINAGASPGLTNLLARECADALEETDEIHIRLIEETNTGELCFAWSKEWLLDEIATKPLVYRKKKFQLMHCFSEEERFEFPKCGTRNICLIAQEEVGTIPLYIKTKNVDIKMYDSQIEMAKFLHKLDLVSEKEIRIGKEKISPLEFMTRILPDTPHIHRNRSFDDAIFGLVVEAIGKKDGKKKIIQYSVFFPRQRDLNAEKIQGSFIAYATALMTKIFILSFPMIREYGVFPPENLDKPVRQLILNALRKERNITLQKRER